MCHCVRIEKDTLELQNRQCIILILLRFIPKMTFRIITLTKIYNRNRNTTNFDEIEKVMYVK
jgi:hypothetical protein